MASYMELSCHKRSFFESRMRSEPKFQHGFMRSSPGFMPHITAPIAHALQRITFSAAECLRNMPQTYTVDSTAFLASAEATTMTTISISSEASWDLAFSITTQVTKPVLMTKPSTQTTTAKSKSGRI